MAVNLKQYFRESMGKYLPLFKTELNTKVDKVDGEGLSKNSLTDALLNKIDNVPEDILGIGASVAYTATDQSNLTWDNNEQAIKLESKTDTSIGMVFPTFEVDNSEMYSISIFIKGSDDVSSGLYLRVYESNLEKLPEGKTHICAASTTVPHIQEHTSGKTTWAENHAVKDTWTQYTYRYLPTEGAKLANVAVLNWTGNGIRPLWIKEPTISKGNKIRDVFMTNLKMSITGGNVITYTDGSRFKWTKRFIGIAQGGDGAGSISISGYYNIDMPPASTVIKGIGGLPDTTVDADGIELASWEALWYKIPIYGASGVNFNNFFKTRYNHMDGFEVPDNWICIAVTNGDTSSGSCVKTVSGRTIPKGTRSYPDTKVIVPTLLNGWTNYSLGDYGATEFIRKNNIVEVFGLVRQGTVSSGSTGTVFKLPAGFRPKRRIILNVMSANTARRVDVLTNGDIRVLTGTNVWVSIHFSFSVT